MKGFKKENALYIILISVLILNIFSSIGIGNNKILLDDESRNKIEEIIALQKEIIASGYFANNIAVNKDNGRYDKEENTTFFNIFNEEIRSILKDELSKVIDEITKPDFVYDSDSNHGRNKIDPNKEEQEKAYQKGNSVVNKAIQNGRLTIRDTFELRNTFNKLNKEQRMKIRKMILNKMESGEIHHDPNQILF